MSQLPNGDQDNSIDNEWIEIPECEDDEFLSQILIEQPSIGKLKLPTDSITISETNVKTVMEPSEEEIEQKFIFDVLDKYRDAVSVKSSCRVCESCLETLGFPSFKRWYESDTKYTEIRLSECSEFYISIDEDDKHNPKYVALYSFPWIWFGKAEIASIFMSRWKPKTYYCRGETNLKKHLTRMAVRYSNIIDLSLGIKMYTLLFAVLGHKLGTGLEGLLHLVNAESNATLKYSQRSSPEFKCCRCLISAVAMGSYHNSCSQFRLNVALNFMVKQFSNECPIVVVQNYINNGVRFVYYDWKENANVLYQNNQTLYLSIEFQHTNTTIPPLIQMTAKKGSVSLTYYSDNIKHGRLFGLLYFSLLEL
jgi:hypothetical protein